MGSKEPTAFTHEGFFVSFLLLPHCISRDTPLSLISARLASSWTPKVSGSVGAITVDATWCGATFGSMSGFTEILTFWGLPCTYRHGDTESSFGTG